MKIKTAPVSMLGCLKEVVHVLGIYIFLPEKKTDDRRIKLGLKKIESLGWKPEVEFEKGIEKTIEWCSNNK